MYLFVVAFQTAMNRIVQKSEESRAQNGIAQDDSNQWYTPWILAASIIFAIFYTIGVWWFQRLTIRYLKIPAFWYDLVSWGLYGVSCAISFFLSFLYKAGKEEKGMFPNRISL